MSPDDLRVRPSSMCPRGVVIMNARDWDDIYTRRPTRTGCETMHMSQARGDIEKLLTLAELQG